MRHLCLPVSSLEVSDYQGVDTHKGDDDADCFNDELTHSGGKTRSEHVM